MMRVKEILGNELVAGDFVAVGTASRNKNLTHGKIQSIEKVTPDYSDKPYTEVIVKLHHGRTLEVIFWVKPAVFERFVKVHEDYLPEDKNEPT